MKTLYRFICGAAAAVLLISCAPGAAVGGKSVLQSEKPRQVEPVLDRADRQALSDGNAAFAVDLYRELSGEEGNFFYSPHSISLALAMAYAGARGSTAESMAAALNFTLPDDRLHPAFNALDQELAKRKDTPGQGKDGKGFRLNIANAIWGQQDFPFQAEYLDLLAENYGAGMRLVDFAGDVEGARERINNTIEEQTENRIKDLIPAGMLDPLTRLVLTNAIYFNAAWMHPFNKEATKPAPFFLLDGSQSEVQMMSTGFGKNMKYSAGQGYQSVAVPYENSQLSMVLLVPDAGQFEEFEAGLDAAVLDRVLTEMTYAQVMLRMPRFKMESEFQLSKPLTALGMGEAFTPSADFSGIEPNGELYIGEVVHKSFVDVDEDGTEAAAATAVVMPASAMPVEPVELTVDRPFIFLIRDEPTGAILFMGRVMEPAQ